jgi:peptidoglycan/xylan/chitin deacetylase (PgdA/CDA1 family)
MIFAATVDDICLDGYSTEEHFANLLRFYREQDVHATFFVVPRAEGNPLGNRPGYVELLKQALAEGHAVGQHGLEHDRFETGVPPQMVLDLSHEGPARERLARDRAAIDAALGIQPLRERIATGRRILEDALDVEITGFRAPCLSICDNLFHALEAEGFQYDSSRHLQEAGWDLINNRETVPRPITRVEFERAQYPGRMRTIPLTTEYTWYLRRDRFDVTMDLARHDFDACLRAEIPFVPVCHVSPIQQGDDDCGFDFYRRLFDYARKGAAARGEHVEMINLQEVCDRQGVAA